MLKSPLPDNQLARLKRLPALSVLTLALAVSTVGIYWWRLDVFHEQLRTEAIAQLDLRAMELAGAVACPHRNHHPRR